MTKPFLKWVGGKTKLIPQYTTLGLVPTEFNTYFEPFLGGGAMFFHLQNQRLIKLMQKQKKTQNNNQNTRKTNKNNNTNTKNKHT